MSLGSELLKLFNDADVSIDVSSVALAAIQGPEELEAVLDGGVGAVGEMPGSADNADDFKQAYLAGIQVSGFRGIGPESTLELTAGPGLTVIAGRNGSGKSSFAEALEVLLTGDSWRWKNKTVEWKRGWRNLHDGDEPRVSATFLVEGNRGQTAVWREWDEKSADAAVGKTIAQPAGGKLTDLEAMGWNSAVDLYRPLLSHSELGVVASNPSSLFDALTAVLGVEPLVEANKLLRTRRLELEKSLKDAKKQLKDSIFPMLDDSDDPRSEVAVSALGTSKWDLEQIEVIASGGGAQDPHLQDLRRLAELTLPSREQVMELSTTLRAANERADTLGKEEGGRAAKSVAILELALRQHSEHGDQECPVCGVGQLNVEWQRSTEEHVAELQGVAAEFKQAANALTDALKTARELVAANLNQPAEVDIETDAYTTALASWRNASDSPEELAAHLETKFPELESAAHDLKERAAGAVASRENTWLPIAVALASWVDLARRGIDDDARTKKLKSAEAALATATEQIRASRFAPISKQAIELWEKLRLQSNVHLREVTLTGKGNSRRVDLDVTVDGAEAAALGVVSQGEINCLALSLFFPRVMLEESPFRFIVIDDPIQAMDPARVDGLARVFAQVAEQRQLVVFTHDDRLPESLRRLGLKHTLLQVTRRPGSVVDITKSLDPVEQYFLDARAVAKDDDLPDGVASRVVPGFCRSGIEAACIEVVRRRRIGKGESHQHVEDLLSGKKTTELAALALFDDGSKGGAVLGEINRKWDRTSGDVFQDCQKGAHKGFHGSLGDLVNEGQRLAERFRTLS